MNLEYKLTNFLIEKFYRRKAMIYFFYGKFCRLKKLKSRKDDSPFIERIIELDVESFTLKSIAMDMTGIDAVQIQQYASAQAIPSN